MEDTIIKFRNANISNGNLTVIEGLNLEIHTGEWVYLTGKVGSGKTSIIRAIIGETPLESGEGFVGRFNLATLKKKQTPLLRRTLGIVFQDFQLLMDRSIEDNLRFTLKATEWKDSKRIDARIAAVLKAVGISSKAHKMPHQLSGGEQQRAAIARAILNNPQVILADEPTGNLDEETARGIMELLRKINSRGTAVIMVTHNMALVRQYPAKVLVCENNICREADDIFPEAGNEKTVC